MIQTASEKDQYDDAEQRAGNGGEQEFAPDRSKRKPAIRHNQRNKSAPNKK